MSLNLDKSTWKHVTLGEVAAASKEKVDPTDGSVERYVATFGAYTTSEFFGSTVIPEKYQLRPVMREPHGPRSTGSNR